MKIEQIASVQLVICHLDDRAFALPVAQVTQVLRMVALTPVPDTPAWLPGLINLRGQVVPVIDLRTRVGLSPRSPRLSTRILIAQIDDVLVGLIADTVSQVVALPSPEIATPTSAGEASDLVSGIARLDGRLIPILNLPRLIADAAKFTVG